MRDESQGSRQPAKREYRLQFDAAGRILGESLHSELGRQLGIALDWEKQEEIFAYIERLETLDADLPKRLRPRLERLLSDHREFSLYDDYTAGDREYHLHISGRVIRCYGGDIIFTLLFLDDTQHTRLRRIYELMFRLANHELKSPLACILGAAEIARDHLASGSTEGMAASLEMIDRNARAMEELIQRYLNLSRIESGSLKIEPVQMQFSSDVLYPLESELRPALMRKEMGIDFRCVGLRREPVLQADPDAMSIVMRNLLSNAIKYGAGGTAISVLLERGDDRIELSVENVGSNIPKPQLKQLFKKFVRLEATQGSKGAGLGLYNARKLVESWGGTIRVESEEGRTRFTFTVPDS